MLMRSWTTSFRIEEQKSAVAHFTSQAARNCYKSMKFEWIRWRDDRTGTADEVRIAQWLKRQGLAQYARAFEEHNIGFDVLPGLGDEDLKELGVPLGDRKRLLKAIADLRMSLESAGDAMTSAAARGPPIRRVDPERRQLTLLFCDLVAWTELSARLDPEDLREVVHAYQACVAAVVERFEGHGQVPRRRRPGLLRLPTRA